MAETVVRMSSDEQKLWNGLQRIVDQQKKLDRGFKKVGDESKKAGDKGATAAKRQETAWSKVSMAMTKVGVSATAAAALVARVFSHAREEIEKAKTSTDDLEESLKKLAQVSSGAADFARLERQRHALAQQYGVPLAQVADVQFTARSEGLTENDVRTILRGATAIPTDVAANVAGQVPALFPTAKRRLTGAESINLVSAAALESRASFAEIGASFASAAEGAGATGTTPVETAALLSVLTSRFKGPRTAADRIKALGTKLSLSDEFGGRGIVQGVRALQAADKETRDKFLGESQELNTAYRVVSEEFDKISRAEGIISGGVERTGTARSPVNVAVSSRLSNPRERAKFESRKAGLRREVANLGLAEAGFERQRARDLVIANLKETGGSNLDVFAADMATRGAEFFGLSPGAVREAGEFAARRNISSIGEGPLGPAEYLGPILLLRSINDGITGIKEALQDPGPVGDKAGGPLIRFESTEKTGVE